MILVRVGQGRNTSNVMASLSSVTVGPFNKFETTFESLKSISSAANQ